MTPEQLTRFTAQRAIFSLASVMSLRMVGLFMVLPVFAPYLKTLTHTSSVWVGVAIGIYGLTQALFQIPFGMLSDYYGRKSMIGIGLLIFIFGSLIVSAANSMVVIIIGRAIQGAGAIGSSILALLADLTPESQRTKAMAMMGIMIGIAFFIAMMLGPILTHIMAVNQLFELAACFGLCAFIVLFTLVPQPVSLSTTSHAKTQTAIVPVCRSFLKLLIDPTLYKLNIGVCILHAVLTASFIETPLHAAVFLIHPWLLAGVLCAALISSFVLIVIAETKKQLKRFFLISILVLIIAEVLLWSSHLQENRLIIGGTYLFFAGFAALEAFLPSLVSRTAPSKQKGSALGLYSSSQFFGIFIGGLVGGYAYAHYASKGLHFLCIALLCYWLLLAIFIKLSLKTNLHPRTEANHDIK